MAYWGFGELVDELARVRALRAAPPGEATNDPDRGRVFGAALQQFDELLTAAHSVGPASAPLPLFYALSQAGRAIAAARCADDRWDYRGHGLEVRENRAHIGKTVVKPKPTRGDGDAFSVVADATGSTRLTAPVELEVLWASLRSEDVTVAAGLGEGLPRPLHLPPQPYALDARQVDLRLPVEDVYVEGETEVERDRRLATTLASYPAAAGYEVCLWDRLALPAEGTVVARLILQWSNGGEPRLIRDVAQTYLGEMDTFLWPAVGPNGDVLSPLMTWWAVLYALSSLARYVPAAWTHVLNRDGSALAVPIENGLRTASRLMPRLVLHAITGSWS